MNNQTVRTAIIVTLGLGAFAAALDAQTSDPGFNSLMRFADREMAEAKRDLVRIRQSEGRPPLTGNSTRDNLTMQHESQDAFHAYLGNVKKCVNGSNASCQSADRYDAAQQRMVGLLKAAQVRERVSGSITRRQYERNWNESYINAKGNVWHYGNIEKNKAKQEYWKQQAATYKPPYK